MRNRALHIIGWPALAAVLFALPHGLSFSQQEILVFLTIDVLLVASYRLLTLTGEWSLGWPRDNLGTASIISTKSIGCNRRPS